jgi:hypothetical protein
VIACEDFYPVLVIFRALDKHALVDRRDADRLTEEVDEKVAGSAGYAW